MQRGIDRLDDLLHRSLEQFVKLALIVTPTDWNELRRLQGRVDRPLVVGRRARLQRQCLPPNSGFRLVLFAASRARESAELLGISDYRVDEALIEMDWGDWEGQVFKQLRRELGDTVRANEARGVDFRPPGGESPREVQARLSVAMANVGRRPEGPGARWRIRVPCCSCAGQRLGHARRKPGRFRLERDAPVRVRCPRLADSYGSALAAGIDLDRFSPGRDGRQDTLVAFRGGAGRQCLV